MNGVTEIFATYKVLEIRELVRDDGLAPIVIIAEKSETRERRRIEVYRNRREMMRIAKMLIAGDVIGVRECVDEGRRVLMELVTYFNAEELRDDV